MAAELKDRLARTADWKANVKESGLTDGGQKPGQVRKKVKPAAHGSQESEAGPSGAKVQVPAVHVGWVTNGLKPGPKKKSKAKVKTSHVAPVYMYSS